MAAEADYLRANGPLLVSQLADVFGISAENVTNDLRLLESAGTVRCLPGKAPRQWEAAS
jgi:DeoR/GlpR family transcriptional regulator of sugar metabolism